MRTPATFGRYLFVAGWSYVSFQGALLGFVALYNLLCLLGGHREAPEVGGLYVTASVVGAVIIGAVLFIRYRRGALDTYEVRRRRSQPAEG